MACFTMRAFTFIVFASFLFLAPAAEAIACGDVMRYLGPCVPYVLHGGVVPPPCCDGVRGLRAAARFTADRRVVCVCLKTISAGLAGINHGLVAGLPGKCGVPLSFAVSRNIDCNRIG